MLASMPANPFWNNNFYLRDVTVREMEVYKKALHLLHLLLRHSLPHYPTDCIIQYHFAWSHNIMKRLVTSSKDL